MNVKNIRSAFVTLLFLAGIVAPVTGFANQIKGDNDSTAIRKMLQQRDQEIKDLLGPKGTEYTQTQREKLKNIINGIVDYKAMARYALQNIYDSLSTDQRKEFIDLFSTIVRDQSLNKLDIYRAEVKYKKINVSGDSAVVNTTAILDNVRTPVIYHMHQQQGEWEITDMIIDDVSTAGSYRRSFQNVIRKKGYDRLLASLRKRASR